MSRLAGLQLLRGLAAMMVLVGHVIAEAEYYFGQPLPLPLFGDAIPWNRGVDIFFVISGFIITLSASRLTGQPLTFLWRRFLRVAPLYYLFTTLMVATLLLLPGAAKDTALDPGQILSSYLFVPYERYDGRIAPVLSLGWTLNYEMFFYLLMALALALPRSLWGITGLLVGLSLASLLPFSGTLFTFWTNPLVLEFLFGIALARAYQRGLRLPSAPLALLLLGIGLALLVALDPTPLPRFVAAGLPAALIVVAGTLLCPERALPGQIFGDASYALYLSHRFTLRAMTILLLPLLPEGAWAAWAYVALACVTATAVSILVHRWIERPVLRFLSRPTAQRAAA
jgi:exopolysaccharide production protein ExoZ